MYGDTIRHGEWALVGRTPGLGVCEQHAREVYRMQPPAFVTGVPDVLDPKARRVGKD